MRILMHHPDIYDILAVVEDYFILTGSEFKCKIEQAIYSRPYDRNKPDENFRECKGLKIVRQLNHGRIEINIYGIDRDNDCVGFQYFPDDMPLTPIETIDSGSYKYCTETVRAAIRKIVILDRDRKVDLKSHSD